MARTKLLLAMLPKSVHRAEQHAGRLSGIPDLRRLQAVVAVATRLAGLAKIGQQAHAPTVRRFCQGQQGLEFLQLQALEIGRRRPLLDAPALLHHVAQVIAHPGLRGLTVAPCAARLLVVGLDVARHVQMGDKAHIGLVDAHAKGHRGHHHQAVFAQKPVLVGLPQGRRHAGVVRQGADAL